MFLSFVYAMSLNFQLLILILQPYNVCYFYLYLSSFLNLCLFPILYNSNLFNLILIWIRINFYFLLFIFKLIKQHCLVNFVSYLSYLSFYLEVFLF
jgi:hypothetical protein